MQVTRFTAWTNMISLMEQKTTHKKRKTNSWKQVMPFFTKLSLVRQVHGLKYEDANVQVMLIQQTDGRTNMLHNYIKALSAMRRSGYKIWALVITEIFSYCTRLSETGSLLEVAGSNIHQHLISFFLNDLSLNSIIPLSFQHKILLQLSHRVQWILHGCNLISSPRYLSSWRSCQWYQCVIIPLHPLFPSTRKFSFRQGCNSHPRDYYDISWSVRLGPAPIAYTSEILFQHVALKDIFSEAIHTPKTTR